MAKSLKIAGADGVKMDKTPFLAGREATAVNFGEAAVALTGSDDGTTYTALVSVPPGEMVDIKTLPKYVRGHATNAVFLTGGA